MVSRDAADERERLAAVEAAALERVLLADREAEAVAAPHADEEANRGH